MGFFSWITQDTNKSILNVHTYNPTEFVVMHDNKGNQWIEENYQGYGEFGGKDFYELLAEMNGKETRDDGIRLFFGVSGIMNELTGEVYLASGLDFFNWQEDLLPNGKSANQLLELKHWKNIKQYESDVQYPNLTETTDWEWRNEKPKDCPYQGFFV